MPRSEPVERPAVLLHAPAGAPAEAVREISAGAEEEGVPLRREATGEPDGTSGTGETVLAYAAAQGSRLEVGIGLAVSGAVAVQHAKLPADRPAARWGRDAGAADWRRAGRTAARIVTGLPLT